MKDILLLVSVCDCLPTSVCSYLDFRLLSKFSLTGALRMRGGFPEPK